MTCTPCLPPLPYSAVLQGEGHIHNAGGTGVQDLRHAGKQGAAPPRLPGVLVADSLAGILAAVPRPEFSPLPRFSPVPIFRVLSFFQRVLADPQLHRTCALCLQVFRHGAGGYWRASKRWCKTLPAELVDKALFSFAHNSEACCVAACMV